MIVDRRVVPFEIWHYEWVADAAAKQQVPPAALKQLECENSWTGVVEGKPVICAGTVRQWQGRSIAWAYVAKGILPHMAWVTEQVRRNLEGLKGRIELTVVASFKPGLRWAKQLGFAVETPLLRQFGPFGEDHVGFVRIN